MEQQNSPASTYLGYGLFSIVERNGYPQAPGAQWRIVAAGKDETIEDAAYPRHGMRHENLAGAVDEVRARLEDERERLLARAEGCLKQMLRMDAMYAPRSTPGECLQAQRRRLTGFLARYKVGEDVGHPKFDGFGVEFGYMCRPNLLVFSLPEYAAISPRFLASDVELILDIVREAGFTHETHWNGTGAWSLSVQLPLAQIAGAANTAEAV